jgi:hypothetical protein
MKKIFFFLVISIGFTSALLSKPSFPEREIIKSSLLKKIHIDRTLTSNEGCTVHIVGDVDITIIPPRFNSFSGSVTLGGGGSCPSGTLTFTNVAISDLIVTFNSDSPETLTSLNWTGPSYATDILNQDCIMRPLIEELKMAFEE